MAWLGAKPRHQVYAQLFGVVVGAIVVVPAFNLIIPRTASVLGGEAWPAPSCVVWAGVSQAFRAWRCRRCIPPRSRRCLIGLALGVALALAEKVRAQEASSAAAVAPSGNRHRDGDPGSNCIAMFLGAAGASAAPQASRAGGEDGGAGGVGPNRRREPDGHPAVALLIVTGFPRGVSGAGGRKKGGGPRASAG
nr:OPT/YSL family transporter [Lacunisphaera limnophila]